MNFEQKQISKLHKQLAAKEDEHRRQKSILIQKIELLQSEIMEYQEKQSKNRQLNESIIISYKQNQSFREQYSQKELASFTQRHQEEMKILKRRHTEEKKRLEDDINNLKCENDKLKLDIERVHLQNQKVIAEIRNDYEEKLKDKDTDLNNIFQHRFDLMNERLRQSQEMNYFFKNQLQTRKDKTIINIEDNQVNKQLEKENKKLSLAKKKNQQSYSILKKHEQSISSINLRINRALVQLNPNKTKLDERIRKIRERVFDE